MAIAKTPPEDWVRAGLEALAEGGPDAVRVEQLAVGMGVSKGGFYWHFSSRRQLLAQMLDAWERTVLEDLIRSIDEHGGGARDRLEQLFELVRSSAISPEGLAEPAIRDWSRRDREVADRLRRVDDRRMAYLRSLFGEISPDPEDAEARCLQAYALLVGGHLITVDHGAFSREQVIRRALRRLLD